MSQKYLLPCRCGQSLPIETTQAGATVNCSCGNRLEVPTLGAIRRLPVAEVSGSKNLPPSGQRDWTEMQGVVFALGLLALVIGLAAGGYNYREMIRWDARKPDLSNLEFQASMDEFTLTQTWEQWQKYEKIDLRTRPTPTHVLIQRYVGRKSLWTLVFGAFAGAGAIGIIASFFLKYRGRLRPSLG